MGNDLKKTNTFFNVYMLIISMSPPALGFKAKVRKFLEKSFVYQIKLNVSCPVDYCKKGKIPTQKYHTVTHPT